MAYKRPAPVDICEHTILRKNCEFCEQPAESKTPEEIKLMFAVRNAIVGAMDAIVAYNWVDPRDETKLNGASMALMLLKLSKRSWSPVSKVFELSKNLAASANVSRGYIERLQRAAVEARILEETGDRSRLGAPIYIINVSVIEKFRAKANTIEAEVEQKMRALARKTKLDPEDAAEEAAMFVAEDLACEDNVETVLGCARVLDENGDSLAGGDANDTDEPPGSYPGKELFVPEQLSVLRRVLLKAERG